MDRIIKRINLGAQVTQCNLITVKLQLMRMLNPKTPIKL